MTHARSSQAGDSGGIRASRSTWLRRGCTSALAGALLCAFGCRSKLTIVGLFGAEGAEDAGRASDAARDSEPSPVDPPDAADDPSGDAGAQAHDGGATLDRCLDRYAAKLFRRALCTCGDLIVATGGLTTDAFDSRTGPYATETAQNIGSDVAINGSLGATAVFNDAIAIGGDLTVAGAIGTVFVPGLTVLPALQIRGDLSIGGPLSYMNSVAVDGDVWLAGDLQGTGPMRVGGDLRQAPRALRDVSMPIDVQGRDLREAVAFAPPCSCGRAEVLDVAAAVEQVRASNDNAVLGFDEHALDQVVAAQSLRLEPGWMFASALNVAGALTLIVDGKSALFIEGDVNVAGSLDLQIGPNGRLDLFVGGAFSFGGVQASGFAFSRPAQLRIYVARDQPVTLGVPGFFAGNLYAPESDVNMTATSLVFGALFARALSTPLPLEIHYDSTIAQEGSDCPARE
jgi:hypothetical protein